MIRSIWLYFFAIALYAVNVAGATIASKYLMSTASDSLLIAQGKHAEIIRENSFFIPFVSDGEFRVRNHAWNVNTERYSLRIVPRGIGESKSLRNYNQSLEQYENDRSKALFNEKLMDRYLLIINLLERKVLEGSYQELIVLYEDRIKVMEQLKNSTEFVLSDLIEAEKTLSKLTIQRLEESQEVRTMYDLIGAALQIDSFPGFDTVGLVSIPTIKKCVESANYTIDSRNRTLLSLKRQFQLAESRFSYERAQGCQLISYVEFSYDNGSMIDEISRRNVRRSYDLNNAFLLDIGIKLPLVSGGENGLARRRIDFLNSEEEYRQSYRELLQKMKKDTSDIKALIKEYEFLAARETEVGAEASLKKYLEMVGVSPLALLAIKESLIKNTVEKSIIYFSTLRNFIYVLDVTGQLSEMPLKNYLYENQELFTP